MCLFWTFHISALTQAFCVWLPSLTIIFSSFIQVVGWIHSFLYTPQFISLSVDGHWVCSYPLVIINNVAVSVCVQVCVPQRHFFASLHIHVLVSPHSCHICYFLVFFLIVPLLVHVKWYSLWIGFAFPKWPVVFSIFSHGYWPLVGLRWKNVCSVLCPVWHIWISCQIQDHADLSVSFFFFIFF